MMETIQASGMTIRHQETHALKSIDHEVQNDV